MLIPTVVLLLFFTLGMVLSKALGAYQYGRYGGRRTVYKHWYTYKAYCLGRRVYKKRVEAEKEEIVEEKAE